VSISRSEAPTPPLASLCEPAALFVLQGVKSVLIGGRVLRYDPASYFIYTVETPAIGQLIEASAAQPYLAIAFTLDIQAIAALLVDHEPAVGANRFTTDPVNDDLLDAWRRMMRLLDRPAEIPVLNSEQNSGKRLAPLVAHRYNSNEYTTLGVQRVAVPMNPRMRLDLLSWRKLAKNSSESENGCV